jgi:hypothetical protein
MCTVSECDIHFQPVVERTLYSKVLLRSARLPCIRTSGRPFIDQLDSIALRKANLGDSVPAEQPRT